MDEYIGDQAAKYQPMTSGKRYLLFPTIQRNLPMSSAGAVLLDLACGKGDLYPIAKEKGFEYIGLDSSNELLEIARTQNPNAHFIEGSALALSKTITQKIDVVVISMLFPALNAKEDILRVLVETRSILKEQGCVLIGVTHPSFDWYMQKGLFDKENVDCDFRGYFHSGANFTIHAGDYQFREHHWTLSDYVTLCRTAGYIIDVIDECPPDNETPADVREKKTRFPTYMLIKLTK